MKRKSVVWSLFLVLVLSLPAVCSSLRSENNPDTRGNVIGVPNVISTLTTAQLAINPALYRNSYHGQYELPFGIRVAKKLFDLYK